MVAEPELVRTTKGDSLLRRMMAEHYSQPKGFVGRQLIYLVCFEGLVYGAIAAGSATRFLPGRDAFFGKSILLNNLVNNTFFHIEKQQGSYPLRNFSAAVVATWRRRVEIEWQDKYGDSVLGFETLVEPPRTGTLYIVDGWTLVGRTKGFTCKRVAGKGTDNWSGRRVWGDANNLRPKLVFVRGTSQG